MNRDESKITRQFEEHLTGRSTGTPESFQEVSDGDLAADEQWLKRMLHPSQRLAVTTSYEARNLTGNRRRDVQVQVDLTGKTLGRFVIESRVGEGAFGKVYRAFDTTLRRTVAIKIPSLAVVHSEDEYEQFLAEGMAAASLNHQGIVRIFDAGDLGQGIPYISMEFCEGPSLSRWTQEHKGPLAPRVAARMVAIMAEAVAHAHEKGIFHRDLKPENTLLEPIQARSSALGVVMGNGQAFVPRICDFGLARQVISISESATSDASSIAGTAHYMAPEQMNGKVGPSVDIFALGVILHLLLTDRFPFHGQNLQELYESIRDTPAESLSVAAMGSCDLAAITRKALAFEPADRYSQAGELAEDLRRYLADEPVLARHPPLWERTRRYIKRHRFATGFLAVTALGLVGTSIGFWQADRSLQTSFVSQGTLALRTGQWNAALEAYRKSAPLTDTLVTSELGEALALLATDRVTECLQAARRAQENATPKERGLLLLIEGEAELARSVDPGSGEALIQQAIATNLLDPADAAYANGLLAKDVHTARTLLEKAVKAQGQHQRAHRRLLCLEFAMGEFATAEKHLQMMRVLFPEDWCPDAIEMMVNSFGHETSTDQRRQLFSDFEKKHGESSSQILKAEFDLLMSIVAIVIPDENVERTPEQNRPEQATAIAAGRSLRKMYAAVKATSESEGRWSIGFARPVLPCIYRSVQVFERATDAIERNDVETASKLLAIATEAYPDAMMLNVNGLMTIQSVFQAFAAYNYQPNAEQVKAQLPNIWKSIEQFRTAGMNRSVFPTYRSDGIIQVANAIRMCGPAMNSEEDKQRAKETMIWALENILKRLETVKYNDAMIVALHDEPSPRAFEDWSFMQQWNWQGDAWTDEALKYDRPDLARKLLEIFRPTAPEDPRLLLRSARIHAAEANWHEALTEAQRVYELNPADDLKKQAVEIVEQAAVKLREQLDALVPKDAATADSAAPSES